MNKLIILLMATLIFGLGSGIGAAAEIHVQQGNSIQTAVNSANPGDVIVVGSGTYSESVLINKPNLVIRSESGNPENTVITAKGANENVFYTRANNTTISGFKVINSGGYGGVIGIRLSMCSNCAITNNNLSQNSIGIYLSDSKYNSISGNSANSNSRNGIHLVRSEGNTISNNNANSNGHGFVLENSSNGNSLINNLANSNAGLNRSSGFYMVNSNGNTLNKNTARNNLWGVLSVNSSTNTISDNIVSNNNEYGMWISVSNYNTISGNIANETRRGIHLDSSSRNTLSGNIIAFNSVSGIFECPGCHYNTVFNNYLNNVYNADIRNRDTTWYKAKTAGPNVVGGPYIGGNYWATPSGTGFSETAQDRDGDGLADTEYNVSNITDRLPLVAGKSYLPVANFGMDPSDGIGYYPLTVQFTDSSLNAAGVNWDFENDGVIDSTERSPVHIYTVPGNYTAVLTAINANGTSSKFATITVLDSTAPILPLANFSASVTTGVAPLTIQFVDTSLNASSWIWDFNNDGISDSTEQSPVYTYSTAGNYTVKLTVNNVNGTNSTTQKIIVQDPKDLPVANFSANVSSGYAPLTVQFTDLSQNSTGRAWDFNNDWQGDSSEVAPVYVFTTPGTYNVNLIAVNENGTTAKTTTISVLKKSSGGSSGGSSSGGSGGAGGSPEPAKNVKVKELCQAYITSSKPVKFDFTKNATAIVYLNFNSTKTVGKTTTIVEMLKNKSTLTKEIPEGEVYNYLNMWVGNAGYGSDEDNLENAIVCFKVEKTWINDKEIDKDSITLNRYNDKKWNELPTAFLREDNKYMYFTAETPGFSPFAITGESVENQSEEIQPESENNNENSGNIAENTDKQTEKQETTSTSKESNSTPGFEIISGVFGLLAVLIYKRM